MRQWASQVALVVKNPSANSGDAGDSGSTPGSGKSPGGGYSNPLQYSCLRIPWTEEPSWPHSMGSKYILEKHKHKNSLHIYRNAASILNSQRFTRFVFSYFLVSVFCNCVTLMSIPFWEVSVYIIWLSDDSGSMDSCSKVLCLLSGAFLWPPSNSGWVCLQVASLFSGLAC